jgi:uncharacterized protein YbjQ (UPF0145 family)
MIAEVHNAESLDGIFAILGILVMLSPLIFPIICGVIGSLTERKHYESIHLRERATAHVPVIPTSVSDDSRAVVSATLVSGAMVVGPDSFRRILAGIRNLFGGRVRSYEGMLDRARREAILRMKEQVPNADAVVNFRLETSRIGDLQQKKGIIAIEVLAYGTAIVYGEPLPVSHQTTTPPATPPPLPGTAKA